MNIYADLSTSYWKFFFCLLLLLFLLALAMIIFPRTLPVINPSQRSMHDVRLLLFQNFEFELFLKFFGFEFCCLIIILSHLDKERIWEITMISWIANGPHLFLRSSSSLFFFYNIPDSLSIFVVAYCVSLPKPISQAAFEESYVLSHAR